MIHKMEYKLENLLGPVVFAVKPPRLRLGGFTANTTAPRRFSITKTSNLDEKYKHIEVVGLPILHVSQICMQVSDVNGQRDDGIRVLTHVFYFFMRPHTKPTVMQCPVIRT